MGSGQLRIHLHLHLQDAQRYAQGIVVMREWRGRCRMRSGMPQGIVVVREWKDLGCAAYQSHV